MSSQQNSYWQFATFLLLGVIIGYVFSQSNFGGEKTWEVKGGEQAPEQAQEAEVVTVSEDGDAFLGDKDAPIVMIEFSDFECSFCKRFFSETLPQIKENYIDKGLVKLVYRDRPLGNHANAVPAAEAAECAGALGDYWGMHDLLFENFGEWRLDPSSSFNLYAENLGLNMEEFTSCMENHDFKDEVLADAADADKVGARGTPTFFINGQRVVGAQPYSVFSSIFDQLLAE